MVLVEMLGGAEHAVLGVCRGEVCTGHMRVTQLLTPRLGCGPTVIAEIRKGQGRAATGASLG